ncbi:LacI family DNA-binding transcriptional regulator [Acidipropionibacterium acidipropionici]|uniref:LacI family DNA-binding transcriptional regulator n=1 Tax=Acidipropionibacterium acidipropionici TaxID=1748 RepID=UPI000AA82D35
MRKPTIKDVAARSGMAIGTVSRVLNGSQATSEASRLAVLEAARELGYLPNAHARSLRSAHSGTIALLVPDIRNPFFAELARVVESAALDHGLATLLCNADEDAAQFDRYVEVIRRQRVDGVAMIPLGEAHQAIDRVIADAIPMVFLDRHVPDIAVPSVVSDPEPGLSQAVDRLLEAGHTRIGFITGPMASSTGRERFHAYRSAMAARGIDVDPELVSHGDFQEESGMQGSALLLDRGVTAILASDSLMSMGALRTCHARGLRIGQDIDLIGFDDLPVFTLTDPPLTVVDQPIAEIGRHGVEMLLARMAGEQADSVRLPTRLIDRSSTRKDAGSPAR